MNIKLIFAISAAFICSHNTVSAQTWTDINKAEELAKSSGKKIMVKVYTNWCGWCKEMDKSTFPSTYVTKELNDGYVAVKFNAEQKENITWAGVPHKLVRTQSGSYHELAAKWLNGKLTYPTIVILDANGNLIQAIPGYRKPAEFEKILAYFAGDFHQKVDWGTYEQSYKRD